MLAELRDILMGLEYKQIVAGPQPAFSPHAARYRTDRQCQQTRSSHHDEGAVPSPDSLLSQPA
jgi:hypothetical protein